MKTWKGEEVFEGWRALVGYPWAVDDDARGLLDNLEELIPTFHPDDFVGGRYSALSQWLGAGVGQGLITKRELSNLSQKSPRTCSI